MRDRIKYPLFLIYNKSLQSGNELPWEHWNCYGGSGFVEALECCYGPNSVAQMIAGKVVSRA